MTSIEQADFFTSRSKVSKLQRKEQNRGVLIEGKSLRKADITPKIMDKHFVELENNHPGLIDEAIKE